jgi:outer membrane protein TolC
MFERGTAAESDYLNVKAERLSVVQQLTSLEAQRKTLVRMLSVFCGIAITSFSQKDAAQSKNSLLSKLSGLSPNREVSRPELKVVDAQLRLADAQEKSLNAALMPKLSLFAQGWYGYPGLNMFEDMMRHKWSLNGLVGVRLSWNIGALYTRKNDKDKIQLQREAAATSRDVFLFTNNLEQIQQNENVERYRRLLSDDAELVSLRSSIRKAAESKLQHGIIDSNDLVREINAENAARVQQSVHEIEMLKEIYDNKFTTNN